MLSEKIEKLKRRQAEKQDLKARIERSGDSQVSTVDKDARLLKKSSQTIPLVTMRRSWWIQSTSWWLPKMYLTTVMIEPI